MKKRKIETKVVIIKKPPSFSTVGSKEMRITMVRLPWEPKVEEKEAA